MTKNIVFILICITGLCNYISIIINGLSLKKKSYVIISIIGIIVLLFLCVLYFMVK
jgi:hypothetical protein